MLFAYVIIITHVICNSGRQKLRFKGIKIAAESENLLNLASLTQLAQQQPFDSGFYECIENSTTRCNLATNHQQNEDDSVFLVPDRQIKRCRFTGQLTNQNARCKRVRFLFSKRRLLPDYTSVPFGYK